MHKNMQSEIQMKRIEVNNNKCNNNNNNKYLYYVDTRVLLENIPLIKFLKTTSRT